MLLVSPIQEGDSLRVAAISNSDVHAAALVHSVVVDRECALIGMHMAWHTPTICQAVLMRSNRKPDKQAEFPSSSMTHHRRKHPRRGHK